MARSASLTIPASTAPAPAATPHLPHGCRSPRSPASAARALAHFCKALCTQEPTHSPVTVTITSQRTRSPWPLRVLGEPRTHLCARTSSLTQPSLIGSEEHNFSSNYIFSTSEKMRFW